MIPFYIFYSMFGFQRIGDQIWAFGDARGRGFLMGATAGRTTLNGEGLQHEDGHSLRPRLARSRTCRAYDPAFAYETGGHRRATGIERMYGEAPRTSSTTSRSTTRTTSCRPEPEGVATRTSCAASTASRAAPELAARRAAGHASWPRARSCSRRSRPRTCWPRSYGVAAEVYSAPSFQLLRNEALEVERWNLHNPGQERASRT